MPCYIVTYDLRKVRNYDALYEALKSHENHERLLGSVWAVASDKGASSVYSFLNQFIDGNDGLLVLKSGREAAWKNLACESAWVKEHL